MTIRFDPDQRRSTHVESGLAVQWVRDEPPMERSTHFNLIVDGIEVPFVASYDYGEDKKANPGIGALELDRLPPRCGRRITGQPISMPISTSRYLLRYGKTWLRKDTAAIAFRPTTPNFGQLAPAAGLSGSAKDER
ncbi:MULTISPECIES: hypothetical protein [unclassified Bradyrhizobium]|uniref:hypothetical protein n=1 Tax=unclassified Bradyrhizobium TaxID=2631580 RepID=UPI00211DC353|nr:MULTISPECIES: hypothetical protein [unclassified Bradyrhizobium]